MKKNELDEIRKNYSLKLVDPRWKSKRAEIILRDEGKCKYCGKSQNEVTLHVHHTEYKLSLEPWEYPSNLLITLCTGCHFEETIEKDIFKYYNRYIRPAKLTKKIRAYLRSEVIRCLNEGKRLC